MIRINTEKCTGCGICVKDCAPLNLQIRNNKAEAKGECMLCGHCYAVCPSDAVLMPPEYPVSETGSCDSQIPALDPDALLRGIKSRRSIRHYQDRPVGHAELEMILEAGRYTATAKNNQDCHFIFVQEQKEELKKIVWDYIDQRQTAFGDAVPEAFLPYASFNRRRKADPADDYLFRNAPVVVLLASKWPLDAGLAAQNMELMAAAQGLGCLYNGYLARILDENTEAKKWLGVENYPIKACMLLGYPDVRFYRTAPRKQAQAVWK